MDFPRDPPGRQADVSAQAGRAERAWRRPGLGWGPGPGLVGPAWLPRALWHPVPGGRAHGSLWKPFRKTGGQERGGQGGAGRTSMCLWTPSDPAHSRAANTTARTIVKARQDQPARAAARTISHPGKLRLGVQTAGSGGGGTSAPEPPPPQTPGPGTALLQGSPVSRVGTGTLPGPVPLSRRWGSVRRGWDGSWSSPPTQDESPRESVGGRAGFPHENRGPRLGPARADGLFIWGSGRPAPTLCSGQPSEVHRPLRQTQLSASLPQKQTNPGGPRAERSAGP